MSKVLVLKSVEPVITYGSDGPSMSFQQTLGGSRGKKNMPDVMPHGERLSGTDLSARRIEGAKAAENLASMPHPSEILNPDERALAQVARARSKRAVEAAKPRSFDEQYAGDAAERFYDSRVGVGDRGKLTDEDLDRGIERGEGARKVGVMGRKFGRGLAGALGGLSFLTGLESAGAAGVGFEQGLGGAALRSRATYAQTAPGLADVGGEAGARIGAGGVGVRHRREDRAAARAARQPVGVVAQPTSPPPAPPRGPFPTEAEKQRRRDAAAAGAWGQDMSAPAFQAGFAGPMAEQNYERATQQAASMLPPASNIFTPSAHEQMTTAGMVRQPTGQYTFGQPETVGVVASPTTESPEIPTTAQGMLEGLGIPNVNEKKEEKIADPTGGKDAAEQAAALAEKFSGKKQSMSNMGVEE